MEFSKAVKTLILLGLILFTSFLGIGIINLQNFYHNNSRNQFPTVPNDHDSTLISIITNNSKKFDLKFNGSRSWDYLKKQVEIGYRYPNSSEIEITRAFIVDILQQNSWQIVFHNFSYRGVNNTNILAFPENSTREQITLFGAHYDTRWEASRDPNPSNRNKPILGANDGASGVAILLEMATILRSETDVGLLFIDAEDQGSIQGWDYIAGSYEFVNSFLTQEFPNGKDDINYFVLFDMIGDWDLNIKKELNSDSILIDQIWEAAAKLGYDSFFLPEKGYNMIDDHIPFKNKGIPTADLIDFDYVDEYGNNLHHTLRDNLNYVQETSLWIVGQTIELWLNS